ncbi:putative benzoate 4-monooxygenase cytochrome P450 [Xylariomycetidae sp. FL0641]|nr:putative benzoate 4-monooxygenase cytochrome P450 [Xylariomycetidae sp. FL0641]
MLLPVVTIQTGRFGLALLLLVGVVVGLSFRLYRTWRRLRAIPGPNVAKFTDLQRMSWVNSRHAHLIHLELHRKYGDVVRMGPNMVSVGDPTAIPVIYPMRSGIPKGGFYETLRPYSRHGGSQHSIFNTQNEETHRGLKNPIASIFSLSNVITFEPLIDGVLQCFSEQIDTRFVKTNEAFDLGEWLEYFAFDVMGSMSFSKRYGFLEEGRDVSNRLETIFQFLETAAPMTQVPLLDRLLYKNRVVDMLRRTPGLTLLSYVASVVQERQSNMASDCQDGSHAKGLSGMPKKDFLHQYIEVQEKKETIPDWAPKSWVFTNVIAGSDSVGTAMRSILFHLLVHRESYEALWAELQEAGLSRPYPRWHEIQGLPYLDACVQEGLRLHPSFALPLERVVPPGGLTVLGRYLPGGTVIGGNPYVNNRHKATFGEDADEWRPERWLEVTSENKKKLERCMLSFGAGRRVCLGRHIGIFEIKKLVSFLLANYDMHVINPEAMTVENSWILKQKGFYARLRHRC